jgi:hypothetical protein
MQPAHNRADARHSQDIPAQSQALRRRKVDRACDVCRRKKTRCDGPKMPNNYCSNCLQSGKSCTYVYVATYRSDSPNLIHLSGHPHSRGVRQRRQSPFSDKFLVLIWPISYVIGLENRMEKLEALLERVNIS